MDRAHPTLEEIEFAVYEDWPSDEQKRRVKDHLRTCAACSNMVARERQRNPMYPKHRASMLKRAVRWVRQLIVER